MSNKFLPRKAKIHPRDVSEDMDTGPVIFSMSFRRREMELLDDPRRFYGHWYINPNHSAWHKERK